MKPTDPNVHADDKQRLTKQNAAILVRLKEGPATSKELATIALKYTSRISDLRRYLAPSGQTIKCVRYGRINIYRITFTESEWLRREHERTNDDRTDDGHINDDKPSDHACGCGAG